MLAQQFANQSIYASYPNASDAAFAFSGLINATCGCANVPLNSSTTWGQSGLLLNAFNNSNGG